MKRSLNPTAALLPLPCALLVSGEIESANIMTVSLVSILNVTPPVVGVSVRPQTYSFGLIEACGEYTINIPHQGMLGQTDLCGMISGSDTDKFERSGLTKVASSVVRVPIIEEAIISLECRLRQTIPLGSHTLFIGEVVQVHVDDTIIDENERIDLDRALPFVFCPLIHEYRAVGPALRKYGFTKEPSETER